MTRLHPALKMTTALADAARPKEGGAAAWSLPKRLVFALMPILSTALLFPAMLVLVGPDKAVEGVRLAALGILSEGRLVVLEAGQGGLLEPFLLAMAVFYVDLCFAFALAYNIEIFYQAPYAGDMLKRIESRSKAFLHKSAVRKALTYAGLVAFVAMPLGGTGAVGGAFFGRLFGLSRSRTLSGIVAGSLIGNGVLAAGAHFMPWRLKIVLEHPFFGAVGAAAAITVAAILLTRLKPVPREDLKDGP